MPAAKPAPRTVEVPVTFWPGATRLFFDETKQDHVLFASIGWGKTYFGVRWARRRMLRNFRPEGGRGAIIAPTYKHIEGIHVPLFKKALAEVGYQEHVHYTFNKQTHVLSFTKASGVSYEVFFASMEGWQNMVGWEFDWAWWDEPGFGKLEFKEFLDQRVGRGQGAILSQILYTGVVQIANWYYETFGTGAELVVTETYRLPEWIDAFAPGYGGRELVRYRESDEVLCLHGSMFENSTLKPDYYHRQFRSYGYKDSKFRAQCLGEAIAVNTNAVYEDFEEAASTGDYPVDFKGPTPTLALCLDFNYGNMSVLVAQSYLGSEYVVWENERVCHTTADAMDEFLRCFPSEKFGDRHIYVYGDSAGWARNPQVRSRDGSYAIVRDKLKGKFAKVVIKAPEYTIPQETRVMSTNKFHANAKAGNQFMSLHADRKCSKLIKSWRVTSWDPKTGRISKGGSEDFTHAAEAIDYFMFVQHPPLENLSTSANTRRS